MYMSSWLCKGHPTFSTLARRTSSGFASTMVRLGLGLRLVGVVAVLGCGEVGELVEESDGLRRFSLDFKLGRCELAMLAVEGPAYRAAGPRRGETRAPT